MVQSPSTVTPISSHSFISLGMKDLSTIVEEYSLLMNEEPSGASWGSSHRKTICVSPTVEIVSDVTKGPSPHIPVISQS